MNSIEKEIFGGRGKPFKGYERIQRYWDKGRNSFTAKILPGELYVTAMDETIVTVLGSCVSACIRDPIFGIGGMNHFMLPISSGTNNDSCAGLATRYGNYAMEKLINEIMSHGGRRENLEVKVFGGGKVLKNMDMMNIGDRNINFVREYIHTEHLKLLAEDLGGNFPRKIQYQPKTGKVRMKKLISIYNPTIQDREERYMREIAGNVAASDIELF